MRLTALQESPEAFVASLDDEAAESEDFWRERMVRSTRLVAQVDGVPVGVASVGEYADEENAAQLFGLWVEPAKRGSGVASALVKAGARTAADSGYRHLLYWVGTNNGRADPAPCCGPRWVRRQWFWRDVLLTRWCEGSAGGAGRSRARVYWWRWCEVSAGGAGCSRARVL